MRKFPRVPQMIIGVVSVIALLIVSSYPFVRTLSEWIQKNKTEPYVQKELEAIKKLIPEYLTKIISLPGTDTQTINTQTTIPGLTTTPENTTIVKEFTTYISSVSALPTGANGNVLYYGSSGWAAGTELFYNGSLLGIGTIDPKAKLHVSTAGKDMVGLIVQGVSEQSALLGDFRNVDGTSLVNINNNGKLTLNNASTDHAIEIYHTGNSGYLSSNGGAIYLNNTNNIGTGLGIFSNAGAEALGNMINVKVDNPLYNQAAFYMNYDGISNAVEIISNTNDDSSNALSVTNFNTQDSALGIIGYETGKGTIKVSHNGTGTDANASGLSIDLKGAGTRAQGLYVDSTASTGTLGNLLRLRNQSIDRFVVNSLGSLSMGQNGTNTTITKTGNVAGDEFFVGTNGAFRVQRSATASEAFRVQVNGDAQGRWLGTSDGQLKWGDGTSVQDVVLRRSAANTLQLLTSTFQITSRANSTDLMVWTASDSSRLGRFLETSGGAGWFEIADAAGAPQITLRADGGTSFINSGNFGIGTSSVGTGGSKVLAIANGSAPSTSITGGVQLYAINYDDTDGSATSELFVRDEDGNATNLSPHNFSLVPTGKSEPLAWSYYSEKNGQAINVDMAKTVRLVEQLSGTKLVYTKDLTTGQDLDQPLSLSTITTPLQSFAADRTRDEIAMMNKKVSSLEDQYLKKETMAENIAFSDTVISIFKTILVKSEAVFEKSVSFLSAVIFHDNVTVEKNATIQGVLSVNTDQVGRSIVKKGEKMITNKFTNNFTNNPIITVTPNDELKGTFWVKKTTKEFIIYLSEVQDHDVEFDWHALVSEKDIQSNTSTEVSTPLPTITVVPTITEKVASSSGE